MKKKDNDDRPQMLTYTENFLSLGNIHLPSTLSSDDALEILGFPVRLENALELHGVDTVGDFMDISNESLMKIRNLGNKSLTYLNEAKKIINEKFGILSSNTPTIKVEENKVEEPAIPNNQLISCLLETCRTQRENDIVVRRYGLMNGDKLTLEEIGDLYGLTRERIRQIQAKVLRRMKHPTKVRRPLISLTEELLYDNGGILTDEEADKKVPQILGESNEDGSSLLDLFTDLTWIQNCRIGDFKIYTPKLNGTPLCKLSDEIVSVLKKEPLGLKIKDIVKKIKLFDGVNDERLDSEKFVLRYCQIDPRMDIVEQPASISNVVFRYYSFGHFTRKVWVELMGRILEEEQMPLHFTEITNRVNDLRGDSEKHLDVRRAHPILIEDIIFAHSGIRGTYGLTSWGLRRETTPQLVEESIKKAGFPLHWKQIFNYVSKYKDTKPANIMAILNTRNKFTSVGRGVFGLNEKDSI